MSQLLTQIGLLLVFFIVFVLIWTAGSVVASWLGRFKMDRIAIFYGRPVFTFAWRICPVQIGYIPAGSYVAHDLEEFKTHSFSARAMVVLAGPVAVLVSAIICLGF